MNSETNEMPLFIIPEWLQQRKILQTDLPEIHALFPGINNPVIGDLTVDLLKEYYHEQAKIHFYKMVRVLGFYGVLFFGKLSTYSGPHSRDPEVISIDFKYHEEKLTDYVGMPSSALLKSCGIEILGQLHGVPILSLKKILDCIPSFEDFLKTVPALITPVTSNFFIPVNKNHKKQNDRGGGNGKKALLSQSINILSLSIRSYNCLVNIGIETIGDLVHRHPEELLAIKNFGKKSLQEISRELSQYDLQLGHAVQETLSVDQIELTDEQANLSVRILGLSARATNCLQNAKITTIGQLLQLSNHDLLSQPNLGRKTLAELKEKIASIQKSEIRFTQLDLFPVDNTSCINLDDDKILASLSMPTKNLILTVRTQKVLDTQHLDYIWQVVQLTEKKLLRFKNFGRKSLTELKAKLTEYNLHLGFSFTPEQVNRIQSFEETVSIQDLNKWLVQIIKELQADEIPFLKKRENQLVHERLWPVSAKKRTLEKIAADWSTSRERVRQIEKKTRHKIRQQYRKNLQNIAEVISKKISSCKGLTAISLLPISIYTTDSREQLIISELVSLVDDNIFFDWRHDIVSGKGEDWLNQICHSIRKNIQITCADKLFSPKILDTAVAQAILQYKLNTTYIAEPLKNIIRAKEKITTSGGMLCFGRMNKQDKAVLAFKKCFPDGLKIHKQSEYLLKTLQKNDPKTYHKSSPRSLIARLADHPDIFLWGRGFYVHRATVTYNNELVKRAAEWILNRFDRGHPKFQIDLPFNRFMEDMLHGGIPNEYALYTLIRTLNNSRIGQRKFPTLVDRQSKIDIHETVVEELENFLLATKRAVEITDLEKEFVEKRGWKKYRLQLQLSSSEKIYPWENRTYIHLEYLPVNHGKLNALIRAIRKKLTSINAAYSLKGAKQELQILWQETCPGATVQTMIKLIRGTNVPDLEINHYLISLRQDEGTEAISLAAEVEDYFIEQNREIATYELKKEFQDKRGWSDNQYYGAVRKTTLFQISKNTLVHPSTMNWNSELSEVVHEVLSKYLQYNNIKGIPHIILSEIIDEYILPELPNGIEWTIDLLKSAGKEYSDFIFFDDACILTENHFNIEDLDDMVAFLLSQAFEYKLAKQSEAEKLLWREGILASGRTLPTEEVFFPESSIKYLPDSNEITLSRIGEKRYGSPRPDRYSS